LAEITLACGREKLKFNLASKHFLDILRPKDLLENQSSEDLISRSLNNPTYSKPFGQIFRANHKTVIIVPDKTRNCGAQVFLPVLIDKLNHSGVTDSDIKIMLANGSHISHTSEEIEKIVGPKILDRIEIVEHDSKNSNELTFLGVTKFETPIFINRQVLAADFVIVAGAASHHYFAGYGGGPKMVNPGCAGYETITKNHALTIDSESGKIHPKCRAGVIEGNPVQEDIKDSMRFVKVDFLFETILNEQGEIAKVGCGDLFQAHKEACEIVDEHYKIPIHGKADLVVVSCGGFPKDINFIQAHKSIQNAFQAVKEGGVILVLAECEQGIGSETFLDWFNYPDDSSFREALINHFTLNATTAVSLKMKTRAAKIVIVSILPENVVKRLDMLPAANLEEGWKMARKLLPANFRCFVIPNGSLTLPQLIS